MKTVIIYRSILGTTRKYARWLAEDLQAEIYPFKDITEEIISGSDCIIVASGTYAGSMPMTNFLIRNWWLLKGKKVIALSVGISPDGDYYTEKTLNGIPEYIRQSIKVVRLPGSIFGFAPKETGKVDRNNVKKVTKFIQA